MKRIPGRTLWSGGLLLLVAYAGCGKGTSPPASVASVTVARPALRIVVGGAIELTATTKDAAGNVLTGRTVTWSSTNPAATVSATGLVSGVVEGTATITATSEGSSGTAAITVLNLPFGAVAAGLANACGITTSGTAYCWGHNGRGALGNSSTIETCVSNEPCSSTPEAVAGGLVFAAVSGGAFHTCGVTTNGAAYCWGSNFSGQLGDGSLTSRSIPMPVAGGLTFVAVSAAGGSAHSCGVTSTGAAYCWGRNGFGQLGDSSMTNQSTTPVPVAGGLSFTAVSAGFDHSCGLTAGGAAYCWGDNTNGQLGAPPTKRRRVLLGG